MINDFYLLLTTNELKFEKYFSGTYYLPTELLLDDSYEIALDTFFSLSSFNDHKFLTINCDLFPKYFFGNKFIDSCHIFCNKNVNDQIYRNNYYKLEKLLINSINISIQNLKFENILFDSKTDFCVFRFHFRKLK